MFPLLLLKVYGIWTFNGPLDMCPAWWHLKEFYILIKKTAQQETAPETKSEPEALQEGVSEV